jgi:hypothetical protein
MPAASACVKKNFPSFSEYPSAPKIKPKGLFQNQAGKDWQWTKALREA